MEPGTGGENPRSGRSQGALKTRSREGELAGVLYNIKNKTHREWHVECERSDVRGVLRHM
jgi:hypothetical protein